MWNLDVYRVCIDIIYIYIHTVYMWSFLGQHWNPKHHPKWVILR
jgi:hypothetical protein